jgi:hypothetical protein
MRIANVIAVISVAGLAILACGCVLFARQTWQQASGWRVTERALGTPFEVGKGEEAALAELYVHVDRIRDEQGRLAFILGCTLDGKETQVPVSSLPQDVGRYHLELVNSGWQSVTLRVTLTRPTDAQFKLGDCTPPLPSSTWRGIVIDAPRHVDYAREAETDWGSTSKLPNPRFPKIKVYGASMLDEAVLIKAGITPPHTVATVTITHVESGVKSSVDVGAASEAYMGRVSGQMPTNPAGPMQRPSLPTPAEGDRASGAPFVIDLGPYVPWPAVPETVSVVAEVGPYRSNEVRIEIAP